jgi:hypothetical protein
MQSLLIHSDVMLSSCVAHHNWAVRVVCWAELHEMPAALSSAERGDMVYIYLL